MKNIRNGLDYYDNFFVVNNYEENYRSFILYML